MNLPSFKTFIRIVVFIAVPASAVIFAIKVISYLNKVSLTAPGIAFFDDAFMFIRYVKHFISGYGFCWNIGEGSVYGCTSAGYLFLITALRYLLPFSDGMILIGTSVLFALMSLAALLYLSYRIFSPPLLRESFAYLLIIPVTFLTAAFRFHTFTGIETTLNVFVNTLLLIVLIRNAESRKFLDYLLIAGLSYISYLIRPDNGLFVIFFPALYLLYEKKESPKKIILLVGVTAAFMALDLLLKRSLFGGYIPLAVYAKRLSFYPGFLGTMNTTEGLLHFLQSTVGVYILAIAVFIKRNDLKWIMVLFIPIFLTYLYLYTIDPIMGGYGRYYYPSLPYFAFIALISVQRFFSDEPKIAGIKSHFKPVRILTIIIFGFFFAYKDLPQLGGEIETGVKKPIEPVHSAIQFATLSDKKLPGIYTNDYKYYYFEDLARVLRPLPAGVSIASSEYGYIGAAAPQIRIIDVIGLHDPDAAQIGFTGDHFYTAPPDMIFFPHFHYTYHIKEILDHPYFREHYLYYPGVFKFGFAINRDSKYFNLIYASFRREFERIYPGLRDTLYQAAAQP